MIEFLTNSYLHALFASPNKNYRRLKFQLYLNDHLDPTRSTINNHKINAYNHIDITNHNDTYIRCDYKVYRHVCYKLFNIIYIIPFCRIHRSILPGLGQISLN